MSGLRRGPWEELEVQLGDDEDVNDVLVLWCPGWTNDVESLILPVRETGFFATTGEALDGVSNAKLYWTFLGVNEDRELVVCTWNGQVQGTDDQYVHEVEQVTLAKIPRSG